MTIQEDSANQKALMATGDFTQNPKDQMNIGGVKRSTKGATNAGREVKLAPSRCWGCPLPKACPKLPNLSCFHILRHRSTSELRIQIILL